MPGKQETNLLDQIWSWFSITCIHCARVAWYFGVVLFVVAAVAVSVFRFWLPALVDRKAEVESYLTKQIGQTVVIGEMAADWQGLYPSLHARNLVLKDDRGEEDVRLSLDELRLDLDILPLMQGKLVFRQVTLKKPVVHVSRSPDGEFYIGKFKAPPPKKSRLATFFRQYKVTINDGRFIWHDDFLKEKEFVVSAINFSMNNRGKRHILEGTVGMPDGVAKDVRVSFDLHGFVPEVSTWNGSLNTKVSSLEISALPGIVNEKFALPVVSGKLSADLITDWKSGVVVSSSGKVSGHDLLIPLGSFGSPFTMRSFEADVNFENSGSISLLSLENARVRIKGAAWEAGQIQASLGDGESSIYVQKLNLADIRPVLDALTSKNKIVQLVKSLYPSGQASDVSLTLYGTAKKPDDFLYKMAVSDATVNAYRFYPAATGLQANITVTRQGGSVVAEGKKSRIVLDRVYEHPLRMEQLQAKVIWTKEKDFWRVDGQKIWLKNKDAEVVSKFIADIPFDTTRPPMLKLNADLINGNLSNADHYFPVLLMKPGIRKWFAGAAFRGRLNTAKLEYDGTVKGFPVAGADNFKVIANIAGGSMYFAPGWPRLTGVEADLVIGKNDLWVNGFARDLYGQKVEKSALHLSNLAVAGKQVINVSTRLHGDFARLVEFLQSGPLFKGSAFQELNLEAKGHGEMKLDLSIPVANTADARVKGEYKTASSSLKLPDDSWLTDLKGKIHFTERSISAVGLKGKKLGGPLSFNVKTIREGQPPVVEIDAHGEAYASHLAPLLGDWLAKELRGKARWQGKMRFDEDVITLKASSNLKGLASLFPYPLAKQSEEELPLQVDVSFLPEKKTNVSFFMSQFVNGKLFFSAEDEDFMLKGGCLLVGNRRVDCRERKGISVAVEQKSLDLDPWESYIKKQEGDEGIPQEITQMSAAVDSVSYAKVDMADISLALDRAVDGSWQGNVNGERIQGDVRFNWVPLSKWVQLRLKRLIVNAAEEDVVSTEPAQDPVGFPALDVVVDNLIFHKMKLGKLNMQGEPAALGWELQSLMLDRPEMKVSASGLWQGQGKNQSSSFEVDFTSTDMQKTLPALDFNIDFESELFRATGQVSWQGAPYEYKLEILNGKLDIHSGKGRLASVEVGAGRLLGAVNVDSLRRRLLLDFSDLSKEGFAFDNIDAKIIISQGVADISNLFVPGPSATIRLEGKMDLAQQKVDMKMSILPAVGGNLAIAGFVLGGPAGGVVTYFASKAIESQMEKSSNYKYAIRGSWDNPVVEKIQAPKSGKNSENQDDDTAPGG